MHCISCCSFHTEREREWGEERTGRSVHLVNRVKAETGVKRAEEPKSCRRRTHWLVVQWVGINHLMMLCFPFDDFPRKIPRTPKAGFPKVFVLCRIPSENWTGERIEKSLVGFINVLDNYKWLLSMIVKLSIPHVYVYILSCLSFTDSLFPSSFFQWTKHYKRPRLCHGVRWQSKEMGAIGQLIGPQ